MGDCGFCAGDRCAFFVDFVLFGIFKEEVFDCALLFFEVAVGDCQVAFFYFMIFYFFVYKAECFGGFCGNYDALGVAVDAVTEGGGEGELVFFFVSSFFCQVEKDCVCKGSFAAVLVLVDRDADGFVYKQEVLVFVDDLQGGLGLVGGLRLFCFGELGVGEVELQCVVFL